MHVLKKMQLYSLSYGMMYRSICDYRTIIRVRLSILQLKVIEVRKRGAVYVLVELGHLEDLTVVHRAST